MKTCVDWVAWGRGGGSSIGTVPARGLNQHRRGLVGCVLAQPLHSSSPGSDRALADRGRAMLRLRARIGCASPATVPTNRHEIVRTKPNAQHEERANTASTSQSMPP